MGNWLVTTNTTIDLGLAVTGKWDDNNSANMGNGIYDSNKWAVVFKYTNVVIGTGATVRFKNHASRAPVVWLVNGNVTINGTVDLSGQGWVVPPNLCEPGPGGFRGGLGYFATGVGVGAGFGPGGGGTGDRYGGSYGTLGDGGSATYGNPSLLPLIGGSGGGGDTDNNNGSLTSPQSVGDGGGGGAILIACSGTLLIGSSGTVRANGGPGGDGWNAEHSAGGSGGAVRLVCATLSGSGVVQTLAGGGYRVGGLGRIRIEGAAYTGSLQINPDTSPVPLADGDTPLIWLPTNGPTAKIVSIGGQDTPNDPRSAFGAQGADVVVPQTNSTAVVVETTNVEQASQVKVRMTPRANANCTETTATNSTVISTNPLVIRWTANVGVNPGYAAFLVRVVRP